MIYRITCSTFSYHFRFPNGVCVSSSQGRNGTCYAAEECSNRGGTAGGNCAGGYGVCCVCEYQNKVLLRYTLYIIMVEKNNIHHSKLIMQFYIVELTCGQTSSENCTYFVSRGSEVGSCKITICPCNDNICQIRLDFATFVINGPSTSMIY